MSIQPSGKLKFSEIENEFGRNSKRSLGEYRIRQTVGEMENLPLDENIPLRSTATGPGITPTPDNNTPIKFSDFYGKRLNMIVVYGASSSYTNVRAKSDYMNYSNSHPDPKVVVVGGFRERQEGTGTRKVFIHVRENITIQSSSANKGKRTKCSLKTGDQWSTGTHLELNIAGTIIGAGGDGGKGGDDSGGQTEVNGKPGQSGTSALGIEDEVQRIVVQSTGSIVAGGGGGGGGGGCKNDKHRRAGSGGGGGSGVPAGEGATEGDGNGGFNGGDGSSTESGNGGVGDIKTDDPGNTGGGVATGGGGGGGFDGIGGLFQTKVGEDDQATEGGDGTSGTNGQGGNGGNGDAEGGNTKEGVGGQGGTNGYAILIDSGKTSTTPNLTNNGTIKGSHFVYGEVS